MAKRRHSWNNSIYERFMREGRGQGIGSGYKPWIYIQDFSSKGTVSRIKGRKSGRVHHLMSNQELAYFYILDWSDSVVDIREQYPLLDISCAKSIASQSGIKYPLDRVSGFPYILTCDFMITTIHGLKARTVKTSVELNNARTLEKLEIERRYWESKGIEWRIVTEKEISVNKSKIIEWLYSAEGFEIDEASPIAEAASMMVKMLSTCILSVNEVSQLVEEEFLLSEGTGLLLFKHLALNKLISFDMEVRLNLNARKVHIQV